MSDAWKELDAIIHEPIDPQVATRMARIGAKQVMDELMRQDPRYAAEERQRRREIKAWRREQAKLATEVSRLQVPFVVAALGEDESVREMAGVMLSVSKFLFDNNAPADLIRDLLRTSQRMLPP